MTTTTKPTASTIRHYILATAGHVDHGKSALVRTLTGIDPDRLPEEKKRGITIDLGFANLDLPVPDRPGEILRLGIVDVPGHEDFVKNMVAGVGAVDAALLVVAADDGWMPQTEEHSRILDYLGTTRLVVALTKADLLPSPGARDAAVANVRAHLTGSTFADAPIVPTSVTTGTGLEELRAALAGLLAGAPPASDIGKPRLPIDRVFALRGVGTVITGTLLGGSIGRGQTVVVQPGGRTLRARAVQSHRRDVESAPPGSRVALNLPDLPADPDAPGAPHRGDVVTLPGIGTGASTFDARVSMRAAAPGLPTGGLPDPALKTGAAVRLHLGSGHHTARVHLLGPAVLRPGESALAQLRLEAPVLVFAGDRFVLRDASGRATVAGGLVLDPDAPGRGGRQAAAQRTLLARRAEAPGDVRVFVETALARDRVVRREGLLVRSRFRAEEIVSALERLAGEGRTFLTPALAADGSWWHSLHQQAAAAIDAEHRAHPEHAGLPLTQLRAVLAAAGTSARQGGVFEALTADLAATGSFVLAGTSIRRTQHRPELPARLRPAGERVRAALLVKPLEPPSRAVIAPDAATQVALRFLIEMGEVIELGPETVVASGSFVRMRIGIVRHLRAHHAATASDLRQALGTTRRILVPLLERLDHDGITRRVGDQRVLKEKPVPEIL